MNVILHNDLKIEIREPIIEDAQQVLDFMEKVNRETKNLTREPHEFTMTVEQEGQFIKRVIESEHESMFLVFHNDLLISTSVIQGSSLNRLKHKVSFGISVLQEYNNMGIGSVVMETIITKAKSLKRHKIELEVRDDNPNAIHLYEKFGFETEGIRKDGFYVDDKYIDLRQMGLLLED